MEEVAPGGLCPEHSCFPPFIKYESRSQSAEVQRLQCFVVKWEFKAASIQASKDLGLSFNSTESGEELLTCSLL